MQCTRWDNIRSECHRQDAKDSNATNCFVRPLGFGVGPLGFGMGPLGFWVGDGMAIFIAVIGVGLLASADFIIQMHVYNLHF